jgi:TonB-linked SusC/RagA family outer membrane protein
VRTYNPVYAATLKQRNTTSSLTNKRTETRNWIIENTLTYDNRFADHSVRVLLGQSAQHYQFYSLTASAPNVPNTSEGDLYLRLGSTAGRNVTDEGDASSIASYFGRVNYSFKNRYLINASLRADGSSKFFGSDRWGYFPSVGVGWVISDEAFMQGQKIFNTLKFRGSWGKIGNASVPSNISVLRVAQDPYLTAVLGGQGYTGASINSVVPPTTVWERGVGTDIGLEAALLKRKLTIEADFYNKKTEQAIFDIPILSSVGTSSGSIIGNQATFQNQGFEVAVSFKNNINNTFSYNIGANFSINDNKVLSVTTGSNPIYAGGSGITSGALATRTMAGQPIGQFFGYQVAGIFQTAAEATSSAQPNAKAGDFRYVDQNKDKVIDGKDRVALGNPNPKYTYGLNTNWTFSQFDLTLDFQGVAGVQIYNANIGYRFGNENFTKDFYENRWHGQGTSNAYPSANIGGGLNYYPNSFYVESGNYLRVRNMQLGYTLSHTLTDRWKIRSLRFYVNAQNAFNFFKYKGFSPEVGTQPGQNPTNTGLDVNTYPLYTTYNLGVNLTF